MWEVTRKPVYKERAEKWFKLMKSRMTLQADGTYKIWNYWEPAGPWDYKVDGTPKHWVGIMPPNKAIYYDIDVGAIADAYEHGVVFTKEDVNHLIATALATKGTAVERFWTGLVPYSTDIQKEFEASMKPDSWGGLTLASRYLMLQAQLRAGGK